MLHSCSPIYYDLFYVLKKESHPLGGLYTIRYNFNNYDSASFIRLTASIICSVEAA